jgi:hypothetical protein
MSIARYSFLPYLRRGVAAAVETPATGLRASISASLTLSDGRAARITPLQNFQVVGPGDVLGVNPSMIVRTEPKSWTTDFEPNYFVFIEFYDEDFPWRFTPSPATGSHRLQPWLTLLVLKSDEFTAISEPGRPLPAIRLSGSASDARPPADQQWAWAHVQLGAEVAAVGVTTPDPGRLTEALVTSPDASVSRLISPRRLEPRTAYHALLVPTFEAGRLAGLGLDVPTTMSGTTGVSADATELPVYHQWYFRTGAKGDFEELVRRLQPRTADPSVGLRLMDISRPGFGVPAATNPAITDADGSTLIPDNTVGFEGALKSPSMRPHGLDATSIFGADVAFVANLASTIEDSGSDGGDPIVSAPIYGRWHALARRVDPTAAERWLNSLNTDPRHRGAAGLGARVIREKQENYMRIAWEQIGDVLTANRKILGWQASVEVSAQAYSRHLKTQPKEALLPMVGPVLPRVRGSPSTLRHLLNESRVPAAVFSGSMRKLLRRRGAIARRVFGSDIPQGPVGMLAEAVNEGRASADPPRPAIAAPTLERMRDLVVPPASGWMRALDRFKLWLLLLVLLIAAFAAILLVGSLGLAGALSVAVGIAAAGAALIGWLGYREADRRAAREALDIAALTAEQVGAVEGRATFSVPRPGEIPAAGGDAGTAQRFRTAMQQFAELLSARTPPALERPKFDLAHAQASVLGALRPWVSMPLRAGSSIRIGGKPLPEHLQATITEPLMKGRTFSLLQRVMAYPDIKEPMYQPLAKLSKDFVLPNLDLVPANTITLLETNPPFIEAYMVGVNHECCSEFLWREYPTDQRGSPFRQFWDVTTVAAVAGETLAQRSERLKDIPPIHRWAAASALGSHDQRRGAAAGERIVVVIRGDLLRRYPNAMITAQRAKWATSGAAHLGIADPEGSRTLANENHDDIRYPVLGAHFAPDVQCIGFDLSAETVRGPNGLVETEAAKAAFPGPDLGWFFVIQEVPGEPRFGLDETVPEEVNPRRWDNLAWEHVAAPNGFVDVALPFLVTPPGRLDAGDPQWGANAADMAAILYQKPVMVAIHGRHMLRL